MRPCKGFSRRVTPLFSIMMVQATEDMGKDSTAPSDSHSTPIISQPSSSKLKRKKSMRKQRKDSAPTEPIWRGLLIEDHLSTLPMIHLQSGRIARHLVLEEQDNDIAIKEVLAAESYSAATTTTTTRPKARGVVVQEPSKFKITSSSLQASQLPQAKDKGKGIMVEPEVPLKKKDQISLNEEMARNLEA
ncbi:hypothetical protein Tco_0934530 [Tanacetum coccineum]